MEAEIYQETPVFFYKLLFCQTSQEQIPN